MSTSGCTLSQTDLSSLLGSVTIAHPKGKVRYYYTSAPHKNQGVMLQLFLHGCDVVFFQFLMKPLIKLGLRIFPRRPLDFFMSVVDQSVTERKMAVDDEEVCIYHMVLIIQRKEVYSC